MKKMYQKPQTETVKVTVSNQVLYLSTGEVGNDPQQYEGEETIP